MAAPFLFSSPADKAPSGAFDIGCGVASLSP